MKSGIVLEGGAVRTIFSSGVCDALLRRDLLTDYVIGVSAGIAYGVSYVSRQSRRNLEIMVNYINDRRYMGLGNLLRRDNRAYFGLDFVFSAIPNQLVPFDYETFAAFPGEVEAVVTNLDTGGPAYFPVDGGDRRFQILRATCALPLLFPVFHIQGIPCLDGGAADPIPCERAFAKGCERLIVVLTRERGYVKQPEKYRPIYRRVFSKSPGMVACLDRRHQVYNRELEELAQLEREGRALVIAPETPLGIDRFEKDQGKLTKAFEQGMEDARKALESPWWQQTK